MTSRSGIARNGPGPRTPRRRHYHLPIRPGWMQQHRRRPVGGAWRFHLMRSLRAPKFPAGLSITEQLRDRLNLEYVYVPNTPDIQFSNA